MSLLKTVLTTAALLLCVAIGALYYLLQPSGKLSEFDQFKSKPYELVASQGLNVKFFGVSTLLFDDGQSQILIDGFFSRPSLTQIIFSKLTSDDALLKKISTDHQLNRLNAILVTHSHYDHSLDIAALGKSLTQANIVGSLSTLNIARGGHVREQQLKLAEPFQSINFGNYTITPIPSQHTPATAVNNDLGEEIKTPLQQPARFYEFKEGGSFDYLIEHKGSKILVKASTGAIPKQYEDLNVDLLFLGIAQLAKQTPEFQKQYLSETIGQLNPKEIIPIHWDNFFKPLSKPLELLPRIADRTPESLKLVIDYAAQDKRKVTLLETASSYPLMSHTPP